MTAPRARFARTRAALLGAVACTALLAACMTELPTAAEIEALDVAQAERAAHGLALIERGDANSIYVMDGVRVTREAARAVAPERIVSVGITRAAQGSDQPLVSILTTEGAAAGIAHVADGKDSVPLATSYAFARLRDRAPAQASTTPVLVIDGVRREAYGGRATPFEGLHRLDIESISVIKDPERAMALVGPDGVNGVIIIRTRNGPPDGLDLTPDEQQPAAMRFGWVWAGEDGMTRERLDAAVAKAATLEVGVWVVDGVRSDRAAALALPPGDVLRVIVAGPSEELLRQYGWDAEKGLVQIVTRRAWARAAP